MNLLFVPPTHSRHTNTLILSTLLTEHVNISVLTSLNWQLDVNVNWFSGQFLISREENQYIYRTNQKLLAEEKDGIQKIRQERTVESDWNLTDLEIFSSLSFDCLNLSINQFVVAVQHLTCWHDLTKIPFLCSREHADRSISERWKTGLLTLHPSLYRHILEGCWAQQRFYEPTCGQTTLW